MKCRKWIDVYKRQDQLHDGGIKYSVGAVEGFDDRDPDEPGVAEQQHEYSQVLLGFRQFDQLGDRKADSEDDRQDQQADHQYVGTVLSLIHIFVLEGSNAFETIPLALFQYDNGAGTP